MDVTPPGTQTAAGTTDIGTAGGSANEGETADGKSSGLEWAQNVNVTKSYKDGQRSKAKDKAKDNLKNVGSTLSERVTAGEGEDQRKKGQIASQGMETGQSIGNTQQEGKKAQDAGRIMNETSIGTILAGGLMGGLSSGLATGLDSFFGTLGQGAGGQVSVKTGIQPPPPRTEPASGSAASTGIGSSSGTGATNTTETSNGSGTSGENGKSAGAAGSSGSVTSTGSGASSGPATSGGSGKTAPTIKPTTKVTKPTTTATKTTSTAGSKPDCSQYRISAQNLTSDYESGLISTSAYQVQMRILRTKYKGCQDTAGTPTTSGTSKTSTQGSTTKKPTEKTMQSCGQAPIDVWHCHGYTGSCCTKGWHCEGNKCGPLDPGVYKATHDCMRKLGIIR